MRKKINENLVIVSCLEKTYVKVKAKQMAIKKERKKELKISTRSLIDISLEASRANEIAFEAPKLTFPVAVLT